MKYIRQGATHKVVIGPAVAVGDGFTPVTTLALTTADEAEAILHDNGTVVDISGYTFAAITTADGYYHLTLQSGISGTVGHLTIVINDDSLILPIRADFTVLEEAVYDALFAASANAWSGAAGASKITGVVLVDTLTTYTGNTPQSGDAFARIGATGSGLTSLASQASVDDLPTNAELATSQAAADDATLAAIAALSIPTVAAIADGVWDEATAGHVAAGSFGKLGADVLEDTGTTLPALFPANFSTLTITNNAALAQLGNLAHGGTASTFTMERIIVASTTTNEPGVKITGNGSASGILSTGGATGHGALLVGGGTSGNALHLHATTDSTAFVCEGHGTGHAVELIGGATTGQGLRIYSANTTAMTVVSDAGRGLVIVGAGSGSVGLEIDGGTNGHAVRLIGNGTGAGLSVEAGATGAGVSIIGGGTSGNGVSVTTTDGHAMHLDATGSAKVSLNAPDGITGNITGNLVGTVSTLTTYTGNTPQTGDAYAALTSAVPDSVPADGSRPTVQQAVRMILNALIEGGIAGTTWTIKKEDGSTTLFTVTLDDATTPTSKTRAT